MLLGLLRLVQIVELAEQARDDLAVEQLIELIGDGNVNRAGIAGGRFV